MKISDGTFVSLSYTLTVDGDVVETVNAEKPMSFPFGIGALLPKFEAAIENLTEGENFAFVLSPEDAYGDIMAEAVVELPINIFEVEGKVDPEMIAVGSILPMMDNQGNRLMGTVKEVTDESVKMDFNHPMAGKTLNFSGSVVGVREATEEDLNMMAGAAGCGCGSDDCDCDGECEGDKQSQCGCGCGC